jgi:spore coat polysaccharide biosynthesis predicted glycosyltransferase SpsG
MKEIQDYAPHVVVNDHPILMGEAYIEALARTEASTVNLSDSIEGIARPAEMASVIIATLHDGQTDVEEFDGGPTFTILSESFAGRSREPRTHGGRVVVSFGRNDPQGLTLKTLRALDGLQDEIADLNVQVALGPAFSYRSELVELLDGLSLRPSILERVRNMAEVLSEADLVVCSGNLTVFEIGVLGTPGVVLCQNARQGRRMKAFARRGSVVNLGLGTEVDEACIRETVRELLESADRRRSLSVAGRSLWRG